MSFEINTHSNLNIHQDNDKLEIENCTDQSFEDATSQSGDLSSPLNMASPDKIVDPFENYCQNYANSRSGQYIRKFEQKGQYMFNCAIGHRFFLSKKQVLSSNWCSNCRKFYNNLSNFANSNNGSIVSTSMQKRISFKCMKGHTWTISYKKATQRWCKFCSKQAKKMLKNLIKLENAKIEDQKKIHQVE